MLGGNGGCEGGFSSSVAIAKLLQVVGNHKRACEGRLSRVTYRSYAEADFGACGDLDVANHGVTLRIAE